MIIAIGSTNKAKNTAVRNVLDKVWEDCNFISVDADSQVSNQPTSDEEGIQGAINRAKNALKLVSDAKYAIGLEGTVHTNKFGMFLYGYVAIIDKSGNIGIGSSNQILVPEFMKKRIDAGEEMGPIMQDLQNDSNNEIRHSVGTGGILTKNLCTRIGEFEQATKAALAKFMSPEYYK